MAEKHGIKVSDVAKKIPQPDVSISGIPFVVGYAPLSEAEHPATAGMPVVCTNFDDAEDKLGYSDDWAKYTLCEFMYAHFKLFGCSPVVFLPLALPESGTGSAAEIATAMEKIELCTTKLGTVPDLICAPGYSDTASVAAVMDAKSVAINGLFRAKAIVDLKADSYTAAITAKEAGTFSENQIVCWPMAKADGRLFHLSTLIAGRIAATDNDNDGVPYETPSNKALPIDCICTESGTEINMTLAQANMVNGAGLMTVNNYLGGFMAWGNYTGCYPTSADVKDTQIAVSRMFGWVANSLVRNFWENLDKPMDRRFIDSILDSANIWLNGLVGSGYLLGARIEMWEEDNPLETLMQGHVKFHIYMTPPSAAQAIDFVLEYDADYVAAALA